MEHKSKLEEKLLLISDLDFLIININSQSVYSNPILLPLIETLKLA